MTCGYRNSAGTDLDYLFFQNDGNAGAEGFLTSWNQDLGNRFFSGTSLGYAVGYTGWSGHDLGYIRGVMPPPYLGNSWLSRTNTVDMRTNNRERYDGLWLLAGVFHFDGLGLYTQANYTYTVDLYITNEHPRDKIFIAHKWQVGSNPPSQDGLIREHSNEYTDPETGKPATYIWKEVNNSAPNYAEFRPGTVGPWRICSTVAPGGSRFSLGYYFVEEAYNNGAMRYPACGIFKFCLTVSNAVGSSYKEFEIHA